MQRAPFDLPRAVLQVLALGVVILATLWIVQPFLVPVAWASTIVIASWPILLRAQHLLGGRRGAAAALMTIALLLVLVVPLSFGINALAGSSDHIADWSKSLATFSLPHPPAWLGSIPLFGANVASRWQEAAALTPEELANRLVPYGQSVAVWLLQQVGSVGMLVVQFLVTTVIAGILYTNGEKAADFACRFARRLAGEQGEDSAILAAQAIRGVALGVIVTALLQTALVGLGLVAADVPFAALLIALTFVLCVAQIGPAIVLIPATIWVYSTDGNAWGTVFLVWSLVSALMDSFVRPVLIRRGADLPLLLIFSGVIGGLIAMGVIGLFLGPVVLAVAYTLLEDWVAAGTGDAEASSLPRRRDDGPEPS